MIQISKPTQDISQNASRLIGHAVGAAFLLVVTVIYVWVANDGFIYVNSISDLWPFLPIALCIVAVPLSIFAIIVWRFQKLIRNARAGSDHVSFKHAFARTTLWVLILSTVVGIAAELAVTAALPGGGFTGELFILVTLVLFLFGVAVAALLTFAATFWSNWHSTHYGR